MTVLLPPHLQDGFDFEREQLPHLKRSFSPFFCPKPCDLSKIETGGCTCNHVFNMKVHMGMDAVIDHETVIRDHKDMNIRPSKYCK